MQGQTAYLKRSPVTFFKDEDCCRLGCAEFGTVGALNSESRTRGLTHHDCSLTERREPVDFVAHAPPGLINPNRILSIGCYVRVSKPFLALQYSSLDETK